MDIIELLNDFSSGSIVDEVFLGEDGQPTDRFLEALKQGRGSSTRVTASASAAAVAAVGAAKPAPAQRPKSAAQLSAPKPAKEPSAGSSSSGSSGSGAQRASSSSSAEKGGKGQQQTVPAARRSREAPLVVHRKPMYGAPRASKAAQMRISHGTKQAAAAEAHTRLNNSGVGLAFTARKDKERHRGGGAGPSSLAAAAKARRQALAAQLLSGGVTPHANGGPREAPVSTINRSMNRSIREEQAREREKEQQEQEEREEAEAAAAEGKARTLQLRLSGQQNALHAVERQLVESLTLLEERTRQLAHAEGRCKAMRHELDVATRKVCSSPSPPLARVCCMSAWCVA